MSVTENQNSELITVKDLSKKLNVSEATVKNWIKLNKIKPSKTSGKQPLFTKKYSENLVKQLFSDKSNFLKSRRNKKYVSGSFFYKDYINSSSQNLDIISNLLNLITERNIKLTKSQIGCIIADCAIQLLIQNQNINTNIKKNYLKKYLNKDISLGIYNGLTDDLIENSSEAKEFIKSYPFIFESQYIFEKNEDILGLLYISLSNLNNRKSKGAYYTPTKIVKKVISQIDFGNFCRKTVIDPCCGGGNFLIQLPDDINIEQIFGYDIDNIALKITRINMALKFNPADLRVLYQNFKNNDFLITDINKEFDYIIGNPPWGAELKESVISELKTKYLSAKSKNVESYDVFTEKSLSCLKHGGDMFFVVPESLLAVKNHEAIRKIILENNSIKYLEFLGNIFDKVQCPSIILGIRRTNKWFSTAGMKVVDKTRSFVIEKERQITSDAFNFSMNDKEYSIYQKILSVKNKVYLKNNALFGLGIVTGNNAKYVTKSKTSFNEVVLKGSDIDKFIIKKSTNYIEYNPEKFQQVAPSELYRAKEKLFYRFIGKKLLFAYDDQQLLSLNSCNILIPQISNMEIKYVMAILNSRISQFVFEKKYNSLKVLRSHIEEIPIPICDSKTQSEIIDIVDSIICKNSDRKDLYESLENKIRELYNLSFNEYEILKSQT